MIFSFYSSSFACLEPKLDRLEDWSIFVGIFLLLTFIRKKYTVLCMDKSNVDKKIMDSKRLDKSHSRIEILKQAGFMQLLDLN